MAIWQHMNLSMLLLFFIEPGMVRTVEPESPEWLVLSQGDVRWGDEVTAMQNALRFPDTSSEELPRELIELGKRIAALPEQHYRDLEQPYAQVVDCIRRRRRILNLVQEALSQLRLDVKYLMFDLEVTREEREALRAQLDESEPGEPGASW